MDRQTMYLPQTLPLRSITAESRYPALYATSSATITWYSRLGAIVKVPCPCIGTHETTKFLRIQKETHYPLWCSVLDICIFMHLNKHPPFLLLRARVMSRLSVRNNFSNTFPAYFHKQLLIIMAIKISMLAVPYPITHHSHYRRWRPDWYQLILSRGDEIFSQVIYRGDFGLLSGIVSARTHTHTMILGYRTYVSIHYQQELKLKFGHRLLPKHCTRIFPQQLYDIWCISTLQVVPK